MSNKMGFQQRDVGIVFCIACTIVVVVVVVVVTKKQYITKVTTCYRRFTHLVSTPG